MSSVSRGAKNAFRNPVRTVSVVIILAISIGLSLVMLLAYRTVEARITTVKASIGNTITLTPAGARDFEGGGEPLTETDISSVRKLANVTSVSELLSSRLAPTTDTNLASAIDPGTLGNRAGRTGRLNPNVNGGTTRTFQVPITVIGTNDTSSLQALGGSAVSITAGSMINATQDQNVVMIGKSLADKNNLSVGSTFTAYDTTLTVSGIFDIANNQFADNSMYMPITTLRRVANQPDEVSTAVVQVNSIDNVSGVVSAIKTALGSKADVVSAQDTATQALEPLQNIKKISLYSLIGALIAGAVITFLIMLMIVRERRKEIGVLKAIGANNGRIVTQFMTESLVLTALGSIVGALLGIFLSNPILSALISSAQGSATTVATNTGSPNRFGGGGGFAARFAGGLGNVGTSAQNALRNLHAVVGVDILLYGLLAAVIIAIIGSAIPAWLIAKVRPAEVMRGE